MRCARLFVGLFLVLGCSRDAQHGITSPDADRPALQAPSTAANDVVVVPAYDVFLSSPSLAAPTQAATASFGPPITSFLLARAEFALEGTVVQVVDAANTLGPLTTDGCTPLLNPAAIAGNIALIERGTCVFVTKVKNAQDAGAVAVVIYDNATGPPAGLGGIDPTITIPSIRITRAAGLVLRAVGPTTVRLFLVAREVPTLTVPDNIVAEATSPAGARVTYSVSASNSDGAVAFSCTIASGSLFPIGTTVVECSAGSAGDSQITQSFNVTVSDTQAPTLTLPEDIIADATDPTGASVSYVASATDAVGVVGGVVCAPSSNQFPIGETNVTCVASDAAENLATGTFSVTIKGAADQVADLDAAIDNLPLDGGTASSLDAKLASAASALSSGNQTAACGTLNALINQLNAQAGKKITVEDARRLIAEVERIRVVNGC